MKKKIKGIKITCPTSMDEISLRRYQRFVKEIEANPVQQDEFIAARVCDIFLDIPQDSIKKMQISSLMEISNHITLALAEETKLIPVFKMGDTEFGFIPKLDEMTFGEYIDLDTFVTDWASMHKAMAVLYRPIKTRDGKKYTIQEYKGDLFHEAMKEMPLSVAMGSLLFFYRLENDLLKTLATYSAEEEKTKEEVKSLKNGVGIPAYMQFRKATSLDSTKSQSSQS